MGRTPPRSPGTRLGRGDRTAYRIAPWAAPALACLGLLASCVTTPVTGRQAFNLLPIEDDRQLGAQAYEDFLAGATLDDGHPQGAMVRRVVDRLVPHAQALIPVEFDWEVHVIADDQTVNAWCMPGGKMAVYTGILPVTGDETGLAVVMSHEIGHAIGRHGTERMSKQMGGQVVLAFIDGQYSDLAGVFENLVQLAWGRDQELEADHIGLILMARAGYDPRQAVEFWSRMAALGGASPPELVSTHPSDETRIARIRELLPEALAEYTAPAPGS